MSASCRQEVAVTILDDDPDILRLTRHHLEEANISPVHATEEGHALLPWLEENGSSVLLLDLHLPPTSGQQLLPQIVERHPDMPVIILTGEAEIATAVACMKLGAFDYLVKPVTRERLVTSVRNALEVSRLKRQVSALKGSLLGDLLDNEPAFAHILTDSRKMRTLFQYIQSVGKTGEPVLISGETGVGKELVAQAIHRVCGCLGPLVTVNVAGLDDQVFSDTLFGHVKGAFTGSEGDRPGLVARGEGGALFLDEIGDLGRSSQVKLLRLLQEGQYYPLGSDQPRKASTRLIMATNCHLPQLVDEGKFRADLYYRLAIHHVEVPPLRERKEDIPKLFVHFLQDAAERMGKVPPTPPAEIFSLLSSYDFPGNVRQLRAMVFDAVAQHKGGVLSMKVFKKLVSRGKDNLEGHPGLHFSGPFPSLKEAETLIVEEAMRRAQGNQGIAATLLGISRQALNRRLGNMMAKR